MRVKCYCVSGTFVFFRYIYNMKVNFLVLLVSINISLMQAQEAERKLKPKEIKILMDSIVTALKRGYVYPDKARIIEKALAVSYKSGAYTKAQTQMELGNLLHNDIQKAHHDAHMGLYYNPRFAEQLLTILPDSLIKKEEEKDLNNDKLNNFYFVKTEVLPGNIGYVRWDGFTGYKMEAQNTIESAFRFVANTRGLIIDMRTNGGGSPETVNATLNYFFDKKLPMNHIIDHHLDTVKHYTDPNATNFKLGMPVYIITSKHTFSGAEDFTYAMKVAKRATVVGDTTGGGAHPTGPVAVGQGFVLNVPNARSYHEMTKTNWEGIGVWPDVHVAGGQALEKAQTLILKDFLSKAANEEEKSTLQWNLSVLENKLLLAEVTKTEAMNLNKEKLQKFCAEFKPKPMPGASPYNLFLILKGDQLYRHISMPPDFKLVQISTTRFIYDHDDWNRYMDVIFDKEGNISGLTLYRPDGAYPYERVK